MLSACMPDGPVARGTGGTPASSVWPVPLGIWTVKATAWVFGFTPNAVELGWNLSTARTAICRPSGYRTAWSAPNPPMLCLLLLSALGLAVCAPALAAALAEELPATATGFCLPLSWAVRPTARPVPVSAATMIPAATVRFMDGVSLWLRGNPGACGYRP